MCMGGGAPKAPKVVAPVVDNVEDLNTLEKPFQVEDASNPTELSYDTTTGAVITPRKQGGTLLDGRPLTEDPEYKALNEKITKADDRLDFLRKRRAKRTTQEEKDADTAKIKELQKSREADLAAREKRMATLQDPSTTRDLLPSTQYDDIGRTLHEDYNSYQPLINQGVKKLATMAGIDVNMLKGDAFAALTGDANALAQQQPEYQKKLKQFQKKVNRNQNSDVYMKYQKFTDMVNHGKGEQAKIQVKLDAREADIQAQADAETKKQADAALQGGLADSTSNRRNVNSLRVDLGSQTQEPQKSNDGGLVIDPASIPQPEAQSQPEAQPQDQTQPAAAPTATEPVLTAKQKRQQAKQQKQAALQAKRKQRADLQAKKKQGNAQAQLSAIPKAPAQNAAKTASAIPSAKPRQKKANKK